MGDNIAASRDVDDDTTVVAEVIQADGVDIGRRREASGDGGGGWWVWLSKLRKGVKL